MRLSLPLLLFLVSACSGTGPRNSSIANQAADDPRSGDKVIVARRTERAFPVPDTWDLGIFRVEGSCLIFLTDAGEKFLPVLPPTLTVTSVPNQTRGYQPQTIVLGRRYRVTGGEGQYDLTNDATRSCRGKQFLVGEVL